MRLKELYLRNFIFGVDDSLVSTVGLLSGVAAAGVERETVILTGIVLIVVEAFSMAVGSFLSEVSAEEFSARKSVSSSRSLAAGNVMFFSYFFAGFIPLSPYMFVPVGSALPLSIVASMLALIALGAWSGKIAKSGVARSAVRMGVVGGIAVALGVTVGVILG